MKYTDLQNWLYNKDLHHVVGQQKKERSKGEADPVMIIAIMSIALWLLVLIALWP